MMNDLFQDHAAIFFLILYLGIGFNQAHLQYKEIKTMTRYKWKKKVLILATALLWPVNTLMSFIQLLFTSDI